MSLRHIAIGLALSALACAGVATAQEPSPGGGGPKKGDEVIAKGCLVGPTLQSTETVTTDDLGRASAPYTYQLKGDKKLLKQLRDEHDGRLVEVTGVLKSALPQDTAVRGKKIGKTSVTFGISTPSAQAGAPDRGPSLPVLEVKSFDGLGTRCTK